MRCGPSWPSSRPAGLDGRPAGWLAARSCHCCCACCSRCVERVRLCAAAEAAARASLPSRPLTLVPSRLTCTPTLPSKELQRHREGLRHE